jgi:hypothetical protein
MQLQEFSVDFEKSRFLRKQGNRKTSSSDRALQRDERCILFAGIRFVRRSRTMTYRVCRRRYTVLTAHQQAAGKQLFA